MGSFHWKGGITPAIFCEGGGSPFWSPGSPPGGRAEVSADDAEHAYTMASELEELDAATAVVVDSSEAIQLPEVAMTARCDTNKNLSAAHTFGAELRHYTAAA